LGHFVEFFGADVWAVGESKIYLSHKHPLAHPLFHFLIQQNL
jgi:hypothetical protein